MRERLIRARDAWAARRWRLRLAVWAAFVTLALVVPYDSGREGPWYLLGVMALCVLLAILDSAPLMTAGFGLLAASVARVLVLAPRYSPYSGNPEEAWVAVELLALPLAALPPLMLTWAIVTRMGKEPLAWVRLPGAGVAPDA